MANTLIETHGPLTAAALQNSGTLWAINQMLRERGVQLFVTEADPVAKSVTLTAEIYQDVPTEPAAPAVETPQAEAWANGGNYLHQLRNP